MRILPEYLIPKIKGEGGKQMAICFRETAKEFHLYNEKISYILTVLENGQLGHLYFGKRLKDRESFAHMLNFRARPMSVCAFEHNLDFSMEHIKQEYPVYGAGDLSLSIRDIAFTKGSRNWRAFRQPMWNRMTRRIHWNFI